MLSQIKPLSKQLVFDLVKQAGVDTSDWEMSKQTNPAANRHKNSKWAFWDETRRVVVLCLWYPEMQEHDGTIFQHLNFREVALKSDGLRMARSREMDHAIQLAFNRKLPVRVIVVDGPRRGEAGAESSEVERRILDPVGWTIATYDADTGACRLERLGQTTKRSFLLTWRNSQETPDSEIEAIVEQLERTETAEGRWSSGNRKDIGFGERVFLLRQGDDEPGLIGWGTVRKESFESAHWDPERRQAGAKANYIMVEWREMVPKSAGVPRSELLDIGIPETFLNAQGSGVTISNYISVQLETVWSEHYRTFRKSIQSAGTETGRSQSEHKLARIAYNSAGWHHPTGEAGNHESDETYNAINKFGHEDWLFRTAWDIDGWRYAFIQGMNKHRRTYTGQTLNVTLYTIQSDKRRRLVATIYGLESLTDEQADDALNTFRNKGWLKTMQDEVRAIGGRAEALGAPDWAHHVLNVRFREGGVDIHPSDTFLADDEWLQNRHRYMLYNLGGADRARIEQTHVGRRGTQSAPNANLLFRRGTKPMSYTPEHARMQTKLLVELQAEHGKEHVWLETDFVDVRVETDNEKIFFEIKSDLDPRAVIRQALGQILEYAYHPVRVGRRPDRLVIVGRTKLGTGDTAYLKRLCEDFKLPLSYRVVEI